MEFKALALKLEQKEADSPKKKSTKTKSKAQLKKARVKALPEDDESRFATFPTLLALESSELDGKVADLNKSLSANHSLRLLPSYVRMDLTSAEPVTVSQKKHPLDALLKMERELHRSLKEIEKIPQPQFPMTRETVLVLETSPKHCTSSSSSSLPCPPHGHCGKKMLMCPPYL